MEPIKMRIDVVVIQRQFRNSKWRLARGLSYEYACFFAIGLLFHQSTFGEDLRVKGKGEECFLHARDHSTVMVQKKGQGRSAVKCNLLLLHLRMMVAPLFMDVFRLYQNILSRLARSRAGDVVVLLVQDVEEVSPWYILAVTLYFVKLWRESMIFHIPGVVFRIPVCSCRERS